MEGALLSQVVAISPETFCARSGDTESSATLPDFHRGTVLGPQENPAERPLRIVRPLVADKESDLVQRTPPEFLGSVRLAPQRQSRRGIGSKDALGPNKLRARPVLKKR